MEREVELNKKIALVVSIISLAASSVLLANRTPDARAQIAAGITPSFGGEYTNLYGSGLEASFHTGTSCDINSGLCRGVFVMRTVCEGRVTNCDASHGVSPISESVGTVQAIGNPGINKTIQIAVFDQMCRDAEGNWLCEDQAPSDYINWYSGSR